MASQEDLSPNEASTSVSTIIEHLTLPTDEKELLTNFLNPLCHGLSPTEDTTRDFLNAFVLSKRNDNPHILGIKINIIFYFLKFKILIYIWMIEEKFLAAVTELEAANESLLTFQRQIDSLEKSEQSLSEQCRLVTSENETLKHQMSILTISHDESHSTDLARQLAEKSSELNLVTQDLSKAKEKCRDFEEKFENLQDENSKTRAKYHAMNVSRLSPVFYSFTNRLF